MPVPGPVRARRHSQSRKLSGSPRPRPRAGPARGRGFGRVRGQAGAAGIPPRRPAAFRIPSVPPRGGRGRPAVRGGHGAPPPPVETIGMRRTRKRFIRIQCRDRSGKIPLHDTHWAEGDDGVADGCGPEPAGIGAPIIIPMGPEGTMPPAKSDLIARWASSARPHPARTDGRTDPVGGVGLGEDGRCGAWGPIRHRGRAPDRRGPAPVRQGLPGWGLLFS